MATTFDGTFDKNKVNFKQKFGIEWNSNPQLYLTYIQTLFLASLVEITNNGIGRIISQQEDSYKLLQSLSQKIK